MARGNDTYVVDSTGDIVTELASEGTDLVQSSVALTLAANVENLTLTGTAAINGTGNALANTLVGNAGNNRLDGGAGSDTLKGGAGDDIYVVDVATDVVTESANEGIDTVQTALAYVLGANVENLALTGTAAVNGTGNALANTLVGNAAANNAPDGGAGADTLKAAPATTPTSSKSRRTSSPRTANEGTTRADGSFPTYWAPTSRTSR